MVVAPSQVRELKLEAANKVHKDYAVAPSQVRELKLQWHDEEGNRHQSHLHRCVN